MHGELVTDMRADIPQYGEAWYHPDAITNIFSFAEMEDKHPVRYNSKQEHAFIVSLPHKEVKFTRNESGLYVFKPPYITDETRSESNMKIDSVEENTIFFTEQQIKRAKAARQLYQCYLLTQAQEEIEYQCENAQVGAKNMTEINNQFYQYSSTYNLKQGIKRFGKEGYEAAMQELRRLNEREVFKPISIQTMTHQEN
jgi:hypothetical protein